MGTALNLELSNEQQLFIEKAMQGKNILVDACIGSGKTTAIQNLCNQLPSKKKVLYLTYNRLLKLDAKSKIRKKSVEVTNYHGFASKILWERGISVGVSDLIQKVIRIKPLVKKYDILIIDEYQDIDQELAELLQLVKDRNSNIQIIAVGDMEQKIYDKTTLNVESFMKGFLEEHLRLKFTQCFRLSNDLASMLGRVWKKQINGVNNCCKVEESAIFTTYDSSKGLERKICVIFDFTESYWSLRMSKPQQSYTILRNIFCVAASRGKNQIIFVKSDEAMLSEKTLATYVETNQEFQDLGMSEMFDFKFKEDVEKCFSLLKLNRIRQTDQSIINIKSADALIDLSPCIGIYQEAVFFEDYQIDKDINLKFLLNPELNGLHTEEVKGSALEHKILFLVSLETKQKRYRTQVITPFVSEEQSELMKARLETRLTRHENAQVPCQIDFYDQRNGKVKFSAKGFADVVKDDIVYELKFVSELTHEHFLQCACYMVAMHLQKGILWNTRDNTMFEIEVPDRKAFLNAVAKTVTKGVIENYLE